QELGLSADQPAFNPRVLAVLLYLRGKCSAPLRCRAQRRGGSSVECRLACSHQEIEQRPGLLPRHGSGTRCGSVATPGLATAAARTPPPARGSPRPRPARTGGGSSGPSVLPAVLRAA